MAVFARPDLTKGHHLGILHASTIQRSMRLQKTETFTYLQYESSKPNFPRNPTDGFAFHILTNTSAFSDYLDFLSAEPNQN